MYRLNLVSDLNNDQFAGIQQDVSKLLTEYTTLNYLDMVVPPQFMGPLLATIEDSLKKAMKLKRKALNIHVLSINWTRNQDIEWIEQRKRIIDVFLQSDINDWMLTFYTKETLHERAFGKNNDMYTYGKGFKDNVQR